MTYRYYISLAIASLLAGWDAQAATPKFTMPIDCNYGKTCFIQNYFDTDSGKDAKDFHCNTLTYNKHTGTDFRLLNLKQMEEGVSVLNAASGTVKGVRDGMDDEIYDKTNPAKIKNRECGNGVVIDNGGGVETQYCHMKKGSVKVAAGDIVKQGQVLGLVGSSGMAEFPHVHFEVRINGKPVDPFTARESIDGTCSISAGESLWNDKAEKEIKYIDTAILNTGFAAEIPTQSSVQQGEIPDSIDSKNTLLTFYVDLFGLQSGDDVIMNLYSPKGEVLASNTTKSTKAKAVYFQFIGKKFPNGIPAGEYKGDVKIIRNGKTVSDSTKMILVVLY